ncbi:hypothetical protein GGH93_002398 [Coemansia aciculifera]|nr:hypothetical protein GGH93_002398 [Coemansia aciculifera]
MPPRKGPSRKAATGAKKRAVAQTDEEEMSSGQASQRELLKDQPDSDDGAHTPPLASRVEPVTPRHSMFGQGTKSPYIKSGLVRPTVLSPEGRGTPRQIFTPLFGGRKYARGHIDMGKAQRAVSRTPFTARRGIADYEAEKDPIKTYIRLKPADPTVYGGVAPKSLLQVVSDKEVEMSRGLAEDGAVAERYLFAGVLPSLAKQPRVFEVCALPVVKDLLSGYNTLLFSYGITNSGKTYTVQGTSEAPGMLPRSIKTILDVLDARELQGDFAVRPRYATQVEYCSDPRIVAPTFRVAPGEDAWVRQFEEGSDPCVSELAQELDRGDDDDWVYQLYVSYFEVYNEMVYDLLDLTTLTTVHVKTAEPAKRARGKARGRKQADDGDPLVMSVAQIAALPRSALLLRSEGGRGGNEAFVEGATEVRIRSTRDLVRILVHGQMRRSVHATGLNAGSSRSHAVFQAKLVKIRRDAQITPMAPVPPEACASVRTMTVVDLAGSERAKRTQNSGDRLAEAGKINVSLMTLKKCLDVRRFNAASGEAELVPYNESKVTRLFQPALEGGAKTIMVVCIDPYEHTDVDALSRASMAGPSLSFTETKNVLDFARVASELVTRVRRVEDPVEPSRLGELMKSAGQAEDFVDEEEEDEIFFDTDAEGDGAVGRKRTSSVVDVGVQTEESLLDAKRQRRDLGGSWQHPSVAGEPQSPRAVPFSPRRMEVSSVGVTALSRDSTFSFEASAAVGSPLMLSPGSGGSEQQRREIAGLRGALAAAQQQAMRQQAERASETDELVAYAEALEAGVAQLQGQSVAAQERVLRIEEETRAEVAGFFMAKIAELKRASADRLADELARSEERAAHKIDILSRLRPNPESSDDEGPAGAEVPTVSPRTAVRRAVSRAASKKANKVASVSAGENHELGRLRGLVEYLEGQVQSLTTQLEMVAQARAADRDRRETLEAALVDANERAAAAEARLMRLTSANAAAAELALTRQHERERAELLAQITMFKAQLRDAETLALRARRAWETQELLPVQERLRVLVAAQAAQTEASADEELERVCRDRDSAWAWWTREQERCSQLCAQNDVLMREIRHLRATTAAAGERAPSVLVESAGSATDDDDDDGFCKISLRSVASASAINGAGDPGASMISDLDRVASKARVLVRVPKQPQQPPALGVPRESLDSLASHARQVSPPGAAASSRNEGGRAKRVVSRVFQHFTPDAKPRRDPRPYLAGRFANTDTAVGCYSAEVFSYEDGTQDPSQQHLLPPPGRPRGATTESLDADMRHAKVRSIVYSGPIVSHATGGVSVTFTSQAVRDLPLASTAAEHIPEEDEDEDEVSDHLSRSSASPQGTKRARAAQALASSHVEQDSEYGSEHDVSDQGSVESAVGIESAIAGATGGKKKRRLHAAHTVLDIDGSPASDYEGRLAMPARRAVTPKITGSWPPSSSPSYQPLAPPAQGGTPLVSRVSSAALPQESKNPVLFTPVRTRSKNRLPTDVSPTDREDKNESIFLTPMKMLNRLRHRKK